MTRQPESGPNPHGSTGADAGMYEEAESNAAQALERLVGSRGFSGLLGQAAENAAAVSKLGSDALDLVLRNLRVAGRRDVIRLSKQLARTEGKLERVLQEVESLRDELATEPVPATRATRTANASGRVAATPPTPR